MPLISVIIPVYNVEPYLRRCLDSVLAQTFVDWECVLVEDGSPDGCGIICDEHAASDGRFRVIHKPQNAGLPAARKTGLDAAKGRLVFHLDSDDWIESDALHVLYEKQLETNADVVMGGIRDIFKRREELTVYPEITQNHEALEYFFLYRCRNLVGKLYKKRLFDNYFVPRVNIGEDAMVNAQVFSKLKKNKLQITNRIIYNYDHARGITTTKYTDYHSILEHPYVICRLWIKEYLDGIGASDTAKSAFCYYMVTEGINHFLLFNRDIDKQEVRSFLAKYYRPCAHKNCIKIRWRVMFSLFSYCVTAGKSYRWMINRASEILRGQ